MLFLLVFRQTYLINNSSITTVLPDFGLVSGAVFSLTLQRTESDTFFIALLDKDEYSRTPHLSFSYASQYCSRNKAYFAKLNATVFSHKEEASLTLTITAAGVYHPYIVSCDSGSSKYLAVVEFTNGKSLLDSRRLPSFIVMPIEFFSLLVILVTWLVNQVVFRKANLSLHNFVSMDLILGIVSIAMNYIVLWSDNFRDRRTGWNLLQNMIGMMFEICLYSTLILVAKGWCIISQHLSSPEVTEIIIYCLVLFIFQTMYAHIHMVVLQIILFAIIAMMILLLWIAMINGIRNVDHKIMAHMMVIYREGIDPFSTPVYLRHLVYTYMVHVTVIYLSGCIVVMALDLAGVLDAWVKDMMSWILNGGLLCALGFLFRSRRTDVAGYVWLEHYATPGNEARHDLEVDTSFMSDPNRSSLIQWEEGMALPPPPPQTEKQKTKEDNVTTDELICQL